MVGDPFELDTLRVDPTDLGLAVKQAVAPAKIEKRSKDFVRFPMSWYERLKNRLPLELPCSSLCTCFISIGETTESHLRWPTACLNMMASAGNRSGERWGSWKSEV